MNSWITFLGAWANEGSPPFATHLFTWSQNGDQLVGRWVISPSGPDAASRARQAGVPDRIEMPVDDVEVEDGRILFGTHGAPGMAEFRLIDKNRAVVGTAVDRLPAEYAARMTPRSIEGHRVYLTRHAPPEIVE
jgi:hypothetical protein